MHILIATDKFKGTLSGLQAAQAMCDGALRAVPGAVVTRLPLSDGGEGFCAAVHHYRNTETVAVSTTDPLGRPLVAAYEWEADAATAWVELAAASGLLLLQPREYDPLKTSTAGTGLLIRDAVQRGARTLVLGLGGSATCDAGTGILSALGLAFRDAAGNLLQPCGENLGRIHSIEGVGALPPLRWVLATDVWNPLCGPAGAAPVFAPQKGADAAAVQKLEAGLQHLAAFIGNRGGYPLSDLPGGGAAGGVAAGLSGWYQPDIRNGALLVMEIAGMKNRLQDAQLLITGEGRLDAQTRQGKLVHQVAALAREQGVPVIACCGQVELGNADLREMGLVRAGSLASRGLSPQAGVAGQQQALAALTEACIREYLHQFS